MRISRIHTDSFWRRRDGVDGFNPTHGPQKWEWWRLVSFSFVKLTVQEPSTGYRVWVYTRRFVCHFDLYIDRRVRA